MSRSKVERTPVDIAPGAAAAARSAADSVRRTRWLAASAPRCKPMGDRAVNPGPSVESTPSARWLKEEVAARMQRHRRRLTLPLRARKRERERERERSQKLQEGWPMNGDAAAEGGCWRMPGY